jgi:hypothetical protein
MKELIFEEKVVLVVSLLIFIATAVFFVYIFVKGNEAHKKKIMEAEYEKLKLIMLKKQLELIFGFMLDPDEIDSFDERKSNPDVS